MFKCIFEYNKCFLNIILIHNINQFINIISHENILYKRDIK